MSTRRCAVCATEISSYAKICPHCRHDPITSLELQRHRARQEREREAKWARQEAEYQDRLSASREDARSTGGEDNTLRWLGVIAAILVIWVVISFFQWLGDRIILRVGREYLWLTAAALVVWLGAGAAVLWRGWDRRTELRTWSPLATWVMAMLLIVTLPDSVNLLPRSTAPPSSDGSDTALSAAATPQPALPIQAPQTAPSTEIEIPMPSPEASTQPCVSDQDAPVSGVVAVENGTAVLALPQTTCFVVFRGTEVSGARVQLKFATPTSMEEINAMNGRQLTFAGHMEDSQLALSRAEPMLAPLTMENAALVQ